MLKVIQQNSYNLRKDIFWKNNSKLIHVHNNGKTIEINVTSNEKFQQKMIRIDSSKRTSVFKFKK